MDIIKTWSVVSQCNHFSLVFPSIVFTFHHLKKDTVTSYLFPWFEPYCRHLVKQYLRKGLGQSMTFYIPAGKQQNEQKKI